MPYWAYFCYIDYDLSSTSKEIAGDIIEFVEQIKQSNENELKGVIEGTMYSEVFGNILLTKFKAFKNRHKNEITKTKKQL